MRASQMPGNDLPTLAIWPERWYETDSWMIYDYKLKTDGTLKWYRSYTETENGHVKAIVYDDYTEAKNRTLRDNVLLISNINSLQVSEEIKQSLRLKVEKAIDCKSRLQNEELLMLQEAVKRNENAPRPKYNELIIPTLYSEPVRKLLFEDLNRTPYVQPVLINRHGIILLKKSDNDWSKAIRINKKSATLTFREKIAGGFGLNASDNWRTTKAIIRKKLLPRANELLQLSSVKRMLDSALLYGQKVLVAGDFVFWFEEGSSVGWMIKEASDSERSKLGHTLWKEGTII
jgi:hypothetical protein